jgi:lactoylglutathione lyase
MTLQPQRENKQLHYPPQGAYVVLRVADIEQSARFYTLVGFTLVREQHGDGPEHYSFYLRDNLPCELFPWRGEGPPPQNSVRIGVEVEDVSSTKDKLIEGGFQIVRESSSDTRPAWCIALDPNGNQVEISGPRAVK